ncbi:DUF3696 domain-containing protein [Chryseobacterium arthrosphaerae]|uniref:DUF3696 domain-containing protein n=1 Tax=Chryseobacterium arthrosphaerae TaxID=651561 RepID=UPI001E3E8CDF|nr:DUF3696 domain-containing protein [Chryseobacterium arthrosphaerae]UEQ75248.1 AAA family ATPase [Chryseobacterium arthrosphaerae]
MKLIDILGLKNFRIFDDTIGFKEELSSINLFTGANNTGKSSVIKSLQMLKNSVNEEQTVFDLDLSLQEHLLGDFDNVLYNNKNKSVEISLPFTFLGLSNLHVTLSFHTPDTHDNYKAKLRGIKVIDNTDNEVLFSFFYRHVTAEESNHDLEEFQNRNEKDENSTFADSNVFTAHEHFEFPSFYNPLFGFVEWSINLGKLKAKLNEVEEFYKLYLENKNKYRWLEQMDEFAFKNHYSFVPSLLVKSFKNEINISDWNAFANSLPEQILNDKADVREIDFEADDFYPRLEIEEVLYYKSIDILRSNIQWETTDTKRKSNYNVIENCFKSTWQSLIQRIQTINYLSTGKEQNSRIYSTASNSPFVNLLKEYDKYKLQNSRFLNEYLQKFEIGKKIKVNYQLKYQLITISITTFENVERDLVDFGYGIKQLILILIQIAVLAERNKISREEYDDEYGSVIVDYYNPSLLIIEEPEANLHPKWQSLLAEMFTKANENYKIQFVIETHSEYLIRKFQTLVAEKKLDGNKVKIFYLRNTKNISNMPQVSSLNIDQDGNIDYKIFDSGFFDESEKLELSLLNIQRNRFLDDFNTLKISKEENDEKITELESRIDEYTNKFDAQNSRREIDLMFNISKLEAKTVDYLVSGQILLGLIENGNDFSPCILQFGRAVEYELKQIFISFLPPRNQTIGGMQKHLQRFKNLEGEYVACDGTTNLEIELNNRFNNPRNLKIDLIEGIRIGRNNAAHSGTLHNKQDALDYLDAVKMFFEGLTIERK